MRHVLRDGFHPNLLLDSPLCLNIEGIVIELLNGLATLSIFSMSPHGPQSFCKALRMVFDDVGKVGLRLQCKRWVGGPEGCQNNEDVHHVFVP